MFGVQHGGGLACSIGVGWVGVQHGGGLACSMGVGRRAVPLMDCIPANVVRNVLSIRTSLRTDTERRCLL